MLTNLQLDALEILVDSEGLADVLEALNDICHAKAAHVEAAYDDKPLARRWRIAGDVCGVAGAHPTVIEVDA